MGVSSPLLCTASNGKQRLYEPSCLIRCCVTVEPFTLQPQIFLAHPSSHHGYRLDDVMINEAELAAEGSEMRQKVHSGTLARLLQGICNLLFGCLVRGLP
jgi:hypothetical protein